MHAAMHRDQPCLQADCLWPFVLVFADSTRMAQLIEYTDFIAKPLLLQPLSCTASSIPSSWEETAQQTQHTLLKYRIQYPHLHRTWGAR